MSEFDERVPLESLDPGSRDPGFWLRFHNRVMNQARSELSRRRMMAELSVVDVVFAWRRALVPMALLAAALAGILLVSHEPQPPVQLVALEEVLTEGLTLLPTTAVLSGETSVPQGLFAMAEGGF
jgi:hypothetical protein